MPHDHLLNVAGSEWVIIIFVALVVILGTGRMPGAARKLGRAVNEFNRAKDGISEQVRDAASEGSRGAPEIAGPVQTEREKLEAIAKSIGIRAAGRTDDELRDDIAGALNRGGAGGGAAGGGGGSAKPGTAAGGGGGSAKPGGPE